MIIKYLFKIKKKNQSHPQVVALIFYKALFLPLSKD